jgi:hypothetical protein
MRAVTAEQKRQILQLADRQADRARHCQMVALQTSHTNAQASARVARHGMPSGLKNHQCGGHRRQRSLGRETSTVLACYIDRTPPRAAQIGESVCLGQPSSIE